VIWGNTTPASIAGEALNGSSSNNLISGGDPSNKQGVDLTWNISDLFVEPAQATNTAATTAGNFSPKAGSPLVNNGDRTKHWNTLHAGAPQTNPNPMPAVTHIDWGTDINGSLRIQGGYLDIGAFESSYLNLSAVEPDTVIVSYK